MQKTDLSSTGKNLKSFEYRITSIKRPGRLLNFSIFRGGV